MDKETDKKRSFQAFQNQFVGKIGEDVAWKILKKKGFELEIFRSIFSHLRYDFEKRYWDVEELFSHPNNKEALASLYSRYSVRFNIPKVMDGKVRFEPFFNLEEFKHFIDLFRWLTAPDTAITLFGHRRLNLNALCPDFIGKKDGKIYLIEVKANKGMLLVQKKMLLKAKDFDFIPLVVRVKINLEIPLDKIEFKEL